MVMGSKKKILALEHRGEVYECPSCNYQDGFHVSFLVGKGSAKAEAYLICPNCHTRVRTGWFVRMGAA